MFRSRSIRAGVVSVAVLAASLASVAAAHATSAETCVNTTTVGVTADDLVIRTPYAADDTNAALQGAYAIRRPNDLQYHYLTYVPEGLDGVGAVPLVMTMHGLIGAAGQHVPQTRWQATADKYGFVLIAPNGHRAWDYTNGSADTAYLRDVIADALAQNCIDTTRIYSTGHSMGGFMTHRVACDLGDIFAAGASYAAGDLRNGGPCTPGLDDGGQRIPGWERMSLGNWHGDDDGVVGYGAGRRGMAKWVEAYDCDTTPTIGAPVLANGYQYGESETWTRCLDGATLHFRTMPGHGHAWPDGCGGQNSGAGGSLDCTPAEGTEGKWPVQTDLTEELWAFLSQFSRTAPAIDLEVGPSPRLHQRPQVPTNVAGDGVESGVDSFGTFSRNELRMRQGALTTTLTLAFEYSGDGAGAGGIHPVCPTTGPGAGTQAYDKRAITVSAVDIRGDVVETTVVGRADRTGEDHVEVYDVAIEGQFNQNDTVVRAVAEGGVTKFWWSCGTPRVTYKETFTPGSRS